MFLILKFTKITINLKIRIVLFPIKFNINSEGPLYTFQQITQTLVSLYVYIIIIFT